MSVDLIPIQTCLSTHGIVQFNALEGLGESWTVNHVLVDCIQMHEYGRICNLANPGIRHKIAECWSCLIYINGNQPKLWNPPETKPPLNRDTDIEMILWDC